MTRTIRFLIITFVAIAIGTAAFFVISKKIPQAEAGSSTLLPVTGYAWGAFNVPSGKPGVPDTTSGIGWIQFNGTTTSGVPFGVMQDPGSGVLSGHAWSSNYGWVSFQPADVANCPSGGVGTCQGKVDPGNGKVTGWARICSASYKPGSDDAIKQSDGTIKYYNNTGCNGPLDSGTGLTPPPTDTRWDGWISLSGTDLSPAQNGDGQPYGVSVNSSNQWSGYAWGNNDVGWISFSGTAKDGKPYQVCTNNCQPLNTPITLTCQVTPSANPVTVGTQVVWSAAGVSGGNGGPYTYKWSDPNNAADPINTSPQRNTASVPVTYSSANNYEGQVVVSDSSGDVSYCNATLTATPSVCVSSSTNSCGGVIKDPPVCTTQPLPPECLPVGPTVNMTGPGTADAGATVPISWSSSGASSCQAVAGYSTGGATSGSSTVKIPTSGSSVSYGVTCYGAGNTSTTKQIIININYPSITVTATPDRVPKNGGTVTIGWTATGVQANKCSVTGPGVSLSGQSATGSTTTNVTTQSTYTVTCQTNGGGTITGRVTVNVSPSFQNF